MKSTAVTVKEQAQHAACLVDPDTLGNAIQLAEAMSRAKLMPKHLRGSVGDCLRVVELAIRTRQSPYALADKTYLVHDKLAFEGQLCAALVNASPRIQGSLNYEYSGDPKDKKTLECVVSATLAGEDKPRTVRVTWIQGDKMSKGAKDKWTSQPEQQLAYYGARVWGRRHAPEVLLGMYTEDELRATEPERVEVVEKVTQDESTKRRIMENAAKPEDPVENGEVEEVAGGNGTIGGERAAEIWKLARNHAGEKYGDRKEADGIMRALLAEYDLKSTSDIPTEREAEFLERIAAWAPDGTTESATADQEF